MTETSQRIQKEIKLIAAAIAAGLLLTVIIAACSYVYSEAAQNEIAANVIRFHVLANSDTDEDQLLKQRVRDGVLEAFKEGLNAGNSVEETRAFLSSHLEEIRLCAESLVRKYGYAYPVSASVTTDFFPTKAYGDVVFPPGDYEALRIVIGDGAGQNWWCVMFPPLCYVDITRDTLPEQGKQQLKRHFTEDAYELLSYTDNGNAIKIKFKIVEWWQNRKQTQEIDTQTALQ